MGHEKKKKKKVFKGKPAENTKISKNCKKLRVPSKVHMGQEGLDSVIR